MLFLCLFYIRRNLSGYTFSIKFHIAFFKRNIIFFQAVRIVSLPILQCFFCNFVILIFFLNFLPLFKHIPRILRIASLPEYMPVVVYSGFSSYRVTGRIFTSMLSSSLNKNRIKSCSVYG